MAQLTIGDKKVTVDDSFLKLSPEDQQKTVDEIEQSLSGAAPQQESTGMDMLKSAGSGLVQGAAGMIAAPAQFGDWLGKKATSGIDYMMGVPPEETAARQAKVSDYGRTLPNPANIQGPEYDPKTTAGKYTQTVAQFLPSTLAGGPTGMGAKLLGATTSGLGSEAAGQAAQKIMPSAEPYARIAGALVGGAVPALARRAITPLPISKERQALVETLKNEGVDLTAGQATGRQGLRYAESELGGGKVASMMEKQGEQFTGAALKRAGINANRATPEVIDDAFARLGNEFDGLAARNSIPPDPQIATEVAAAVVDYANLVPSAARAPVVSNVANDMINAAQNGLSGPKYQAFRSRLETMARASKDPQLTQALRTIRESLDDAMERNLAASGSPDLGAWREVRNQYRNMIVIEKAATGAGERAAEGIISPSALRNATVNKQGMRNYARGKGDFADLARAGEATMKPLPQSGTAPRTAVRAMGASVPTLIGAAAGSGGGVPGMLAGGMAGAAAPYAMGRALLSGPVRKYLSNQLVSGSKIPLSQRMAIALAGSAPRINYSGGH